MEEEENKGTRGARRKNRRHPYSEKCFVGCVEGEVEGCRCRRKVRAELGVGGKGRRTGRDIFIGKVEVVVVMVVVVGVLKPRTGTLSRTWFSEGGKGGRGGAERAA